MTLFFFILFMELIYCVIKETYEFTDNEVSRFFKLFLKMNSVKKFTGESRHLYGLNIIEYKFYVRYVTIS